jgi:hypothetical protein
MGLPEASVTGLARTYPGITVAARLDRSRLGFWRRLRAVFEPDFGPVVAVSVPIQGIRGRHSQVPQRYQLLVDTANIGGRLADVWISSPADKDILHVNVWPAKKLFCPYAGRYLPSLCWHTYQDAWLRAPAQSRTLGAMLEYARQFLSTENHDSPAR